MKKLIIASTSTVHGSGYLSYILPVLKEHFKNVFEQTKATGGLAASIFHYGEISIPELKKYLKEQKVAIR